ncbi:MAG: ABC-type sugar transport system substrate-binding protein [Flavobacteriales bacterium]
MGQYFVDITLGNGRFKMCISLGPSAPRNHRFYYPGAFVTVTYRYTLQLIVHIGHCLRRVFCLALLLVYTSQSLADSKPSITFINPDYPGASFWGSVTQLMQLVAEDLGIELEVLYSNGNRFHNISHIKSIVSRDHKPDYVIFMYSGVEGLKILKQTERAKIFSISFNSDIPLEYRDKVGLPGENFNYWLAHLVPDDENAGYTLGKFLLEYVPKDDTQISIGALSGGYSSFMANLRLQGLQRALDESTSRKDQLRQAIPASWDGQDTQAKVAGLISRYNDINVIWGGNAKIAIEAEKALSTQQINGYKSVRVVGFDWTSEMINAISNRQVIATMGGHFIDGAIALILAYDHFHGIPMALSKKKINTRLSLLSMNNVDAMRKIIDPEHWEEKDFRQLSKFHNPNIPTKTLDTEIFRKFLLSTNPH